MKRLTRKEIIELINTISKDARRINLPEGYAVIQALEDAGILILVDDEPKEGDLVNLIHKNLPYDPSYWIYKNDSEDNSRWHHRIIQRNNIPAYNCKKEGE